MRWILVCPLPLCCRAAGLVAPPVPYCGVADDDDDDDLYFERKMRLLSACLPFYDPLAVPVNV